MHAEEQAVNMGEPKQWRGERPANLRTVRFSPGLNDAVREVHGLLNRGYREVVDADLSSYFDTIPHHELMKSIARRVSDGEMLTLIKSWLEMAVEEDDGKGGKRRTTLNKDSGRGTPQGAPISPTFAGLAGPKIVPSAGRCDPQAWRKSGAGAFW